MTSLSLDRFSILSDAYNVWRICEQLNMSFPKDLNSIPIWQYPLIDAPPMDYFVFVALFPIL